MMKRTAVCALLAAAVASGVLADAGPRAKAAKREESPALAEAEERLIQLRKQQKDVLELYEKKKVGRDEAKAELVPLIAEEKRITDDPGYQAELRLSQAAAAKERRKEADAAWRTHLRMQEDLQRLRAQPSVSGISAVVKASALTPGTWRPRRPPTARPARSGLGLEGDLEEFRQPPA